jgi:GH18 family chitinase
MNYKQIAALGGNMQTSDTLSMPGNVLMYYNTISTIKMKTQLAKEQASGVMIWQILGDAAEERSLLNAIHEVLRSPK